MPTAKTTQTQKKIDVKKGLNDIMQARETMKSLGVKMSFQQFETMVTNLHKNGK